MVEYIAKGIVHAGLINPWKTNKEGIFEQVTDEINKLAKEGWILVTAIPAGNNDRGIYIFKK
ncbi:hypothetical protein HQ533_03115 [Candidatus Woesearchaeota archaeon]|nr:hypothetical protein [Candidatus Woesearchaeota archaeon]